MKISTNYLLLSTIVGGILFNLLFWNERLAINLLIYSLFIITITACNTEIFQQMKFRLYAAAHLFAAVLVVINNSDLTLASYYISFILFIGFTHYKQIRTVYVAFLAGILQIFAAPLSLIKSIITMKIGSLNLKPIFRPLKYVVFPLIIVFIFTAVYSAANDVFAHYLHVALERILLILNNIFSFIFRDLSFIRFLHVCFGIILTAGLLIKFFDNTLEQTEMICGEDLIRKRRNQINKTLWQELTKIFTGAITSKKLALKTEYITGIVSFVALNLLLLTVNLIDISTLWFGYNPTGNFSSDLHSGTNALIFSIILAMAVILYFFRGNLNFYSKSKTLKILAFTWMVQNFILIISVFIRDGYYIEFYGLTHKRIGVLVFALLCIIGLATVYLKIAKQKTLFFLFKLNGSIWFVLMLAFSIVNWDVSIARYNLAKSDKIALDADYLLSLSDKTLFVLDQHRSKLYYTPPQKSGDREIAKPQTGDYYNRLLDQRIIYFKDRYHQYSWLSWNLPDWNTAEYFRINKKEHE